MISFWNKLGIRTRITLGFLPLILLMTLLSFNAVRGVGGVSDLFGSYRATAARSLAIGDMNNALQTMRLSAFQYRMQPSADMVANFEAGAAGILKNGEEAVKLAAGDGDVLGDLGRIHDEAVAYADAFRQLVALQKRRETLTTAIMDFGPWTTIALADIMRSAWRQRDIETLNQAGTMADLTSRSLLSTERFLSSADPAHYEDAKAKLEKAAAGTKALAALVSGPLQKGRMNSIDRLMANYGSRLDDVKGVVMASQTIWKEKLDRIGPSLQSKFAALQTQIVERQRELGPAGQAMAESTSRSTVAISILLIAVGLALAYVVGRLIAHAVKQMASVMQRIAGGDDAGEVEGVEHPHELGAMARALRIFQETGRAKIAAEIDAERTRRSAEDTKRITEAEKAEESRCMAHAFGELASALDGLAAGDLTVRIGALDPRYAEIAGKFNASVASLEEVIVSVVSATGWISTGLDEITTASGDLSHRTEQQAASLEETVAALSQVTRGVNMTAQSADAANSAASLAQLEAEKGGRVVTEAVAAMAAIETSSEKIGRIIGVIDEISFQTNLLALNAGVEAARAGEAGRGFAVVAQEVRGLAQRSAEAAKEIKDLISTSSTQVAQGVDLVSASGHSLEQIVAQVGGVAQVIADMARSAREQAMSLREVSTAADQMDKVTQQNAAMVEETTAAAQSLSAEMQQLAHMTERFQIRPANGAARRTPTTVPARRTAPVAAASRAPVAQMRTAGRGGAAVQPNAQGWEDF